MEDKLVYREISEGNSVGVSMDFMVSGVQIVREGGFQKISGFMRI